MTGVRTHYTLCISTPLCCNNSFCNKPTKGSRPVAGLYISEIQHLPCIQSREETANRQNCHRMLPFIVNWRHLYCAAVFWVHGQQRWKGEGRRERGRERQLRSLSYDGWWQWSLGRLWLQPGSCKRLNTAISFCAVLSACSITQTSDYTCLIVDLHGLLPNA